MDNKPKLLDSAVENPLWIVFLGACPALASTTGLLPALAMGIAVIVIMLVSGLILSALRNVIPQSAKIPAGLLVTAFITGAVQMLMSAFLPKAAQNISLYIAVLAVDLLICGSAVDYSANNKAASAAWDSLIWGLRFLVVLIVTALIREVFGSAQIAGLAIPFMEDFTVPVLTKAPGGFFVLAVVCAIFSSCRPLNRENASGHFASDAAGKSENA